MIRNRQLFRSWTGSPNTRHNLIADTRANRLECFTAPTTYRLPIRSGLPAIGFQWSPDFRRSGIAGLRIEPGRGRHDTANHWTSSITFSVPRVSSALNGRAGH